MFCWTELSIISFQYFRKLSTAISVVYVETWQKDNFLALPANDRANLQQTLAKLTDIYGERVCSFLKWL